MITFIVVIFFLCLCSFGGYALISVSSHKNTGQIAFTIPALLHNTSITLGVARTKASQERGLSGQVTLSPDHGLYFVFDHSDHWGIWMKDMNFPIDVLWFNEAGRVVYIKTNFQPSSFPEVVTPELLIRTILEVPAGFAQAHQISLGDTLIFPEKKP